MSRPEAWSNAEDRIILAARDKKLRHASIAYVLQREGFGVHTAESVRGRYRRLMERGRNKETCGDMDQHSLDCARAKLDDDSFQRAMTREGYRQHCSTKAGTDSPKTVTPPSMGSCTSSAGWGV